MRPVGAESLKNRAFRDRLGFALAGLRTGWRRERSFRTQVLIGAAVVIALAVRGAPPFWWAVTALAIALVLALELVNSALEALVDHLHPEAHPEVRRVKDLAAGAVLVASIGAVIVAGLLVSRLI